MESYGVATKNSAAEIIRLHGVSGPHSLQLALLDSETVIFTYAIRSMGSVRSLAGAADSYEFETDSGYERDGSTQTFTGQILSAPVEPGSVEVAATAGAPVLYDSEKDGVLYAQVAARKIGAAGSWATLASESFVVAFDGDPSITVDLGTEATIAAAVIAINAVLTAAGTGGTAVARDANNIDLVGVTVGEGGSVQVVSADAGITTKIGIAVGTATNAFGTINYFTGALEIVYANGYAPSAGGTADPAVLTGSVAGTLVGGNRTWNMAPADTLVADINNVGDKTATFDAAQSTKSGEGGSFVTSSSESMVVKVNGGDNQTIAMTAGSETDIATYIARLNSQMIGCHAVANPNSLGGCVGKVNELKADWNAHVIDVTSHTTTDVAHVTAVADASIAGGVASCDLLFDDLKLQMNAHLIAVSEEEEAITLCAELRVDYLAHLLVESHQEECVTLVNEIRDSHIAHIGALTVLAECYLTLNDIQTQYEAHRVNTTHHSVSNTTDDISGTPAATTFATASALADAIKGAFNNHRTDINEDSHPTDDDANDITAGGAAATVVNLQAITNDCLTQYDAHLADSGSWHVSPDVTNVTTEDPAGTAGIHFEEDVTNTIGAAATDYATAYTLASDIFAKYNLHRTDGNLPGPPPEVAGWHETDDDANILATAPDPATTPTELVATLTEMKVDINKHYNNTGAAYHENADTANLIASDLPGVAAVHKVDDVTNDSVSGVPASLANCYTVSDEIRTEYNGHRISTTHHAVADTTNTVAPAAAPATLDELILLLHDLKVKLVPHNANTGGGYHYNADTANDTTSPNVRTSAIHEIDDTTNTIGGTSDGTLGTLLTILTELQTDYNAHRTQATIHDANDTTNVSARSDDSIDLVSDQFGTGSVVQIVSGDAILLENTGLRTGSSTVGTGDVADINNVTYAEIKALVEEDIKTAVAADLVVVTINSSYQIVLTTVATGASAEIDLNTCNCATVLGLSLTATVGEAVTTDPTPMLVDYVKGVSRSGPGRYLEMIPNIPEGAELLVYGLAQSGSCRVQAKMDAIRF